MQRHPATIQRVESIEDFAAISAELADPFCDRAGVLARVSLDEARWDEVKKAFQMQLATAAQSPASAELLVRFKRAFEAARAARADSSKVPTNRSDPAMPAVVARPPETAAEAPVHTPSYLKAENQPQARAMPSHLLPERGLGISIGAPLARPPSTPPPAAAPAPPGIVIGIGAPGALPPSAVPMAARPPGLGSTASMPAARPAGKPTTLPFEIPAAGVPGARKMSPSTPMPFVQNPGVAEPARNSSLRAGGPEPPRNSSLRAGGPEPPRKSLSTGTAMSAEGMPIKSLPFRGKGAPEGENLTGWDVERYAALCIDLHASGRARADVLADHRLSEAQFKSLDTFWEGQLARDPSLQKQWADASTNRRRQLGLK